MQTHPASLTATLTRVEKMMPKEAFTPNILHLLIYWLWSGHYMPERCWLRPFDQVLHAQRRN